MVSWSRLAFSPSRTLCEPLVSPVSVGAERRACGADAFRGSLSSPHHLAPHPPPWPRLMGAGVSTCLKLIQSHSPSQSLGIGPQTTEIVPEPRMKEAAGLRRLPLAHVPMEGEDAGREWEGERADRGGERKRREGQTRKPRRAGTARRRDKAAPAGRRREP